MMWFDGLVQPLFDHSFTVTGDQVYDAALTAGFLFVLYTLFGCLFFSSPYGKFANQSFGIELDPRFGWWLMELPATVSFLYFYPQGPNMMKPVPLLMAFLWCKHYGNRGWYFPLSIRVAPGHKSSFSVTVAFSGVVFTALHGYLNAMWFSKFASHLESADWLSSPPFVIGFFMYEFAFWFTVQSEGIMRNIRDVNPKPGEPRYKIPYGGGFTYVSSPQYLGELLCFLGWTIMTWNPAGLVVFATSLCNLLPRALQTHAWYRTKFEDYPRDRKAIIPMVW